MMNAYEVKELAERIRNSEEWIEEDVRALCEAAGMGAEFEAADGETFESVVFAAADALGVEIL